MAIVRLSRRRLLTAAAGGTVAVGATGLWLGIERIQSERFRRPVDRQGFSPNVYLGVLPDNRVEIWVTRSEMGQGVSTALPMLIVEELDAAWHSITIHQAQATGAQDYGQLFTAASSSISSMWIELRRAGALAREMLISAAAERWGVDRDDCTTQEGFVLNGSDRIAYGDLVDTARDQWVPIRPALKDSAQFALIGTSPARLDLPAKVTGEAIYGADVVLPGMLRAVLLRPPSRGLRLKRLDDQAARAKPGVVDVFETGAGIAVIGETTYAALQGRSALQVDWDLPASELNGGLSVSAGLRASLENAAFPALTSGEDITGGAIHTATYEVPFLAHACMEPMNCTVRLEAGSCELWVGTQAPEGARATAARIAGIPAEHVIVNVTQLGGGFGRRTGQDFVAEAVEIAARLDRPVQLFWSREDDLAHGACRDAAMLSMTAAGEDLASLSLSCRMATATTGPRAEPGMGPLMGWDNLAYRLSGLQVRWAGLPTPIETTIWRSVGYSYNMFALESFVDEIAERRGKDPVEVRRALIAPDSPLLSCLDAVVDDARWSAGDGRALGLASYDFASTSVAMVAEVAGVAGEGEGEGEGESDDWRVSRVWCVVDCGVVVHADAAKAQIEGGILFGLSAALHESIDVVDGRITNRNFHDYRLARLSDAPEIFVRFLSSKRDPGGLGEASTPGVAPAVANALHRLTGKRHRTLPLKG